MCTGVCVCHGVCVCERAARRAPRTLARTTACVCQPQFEELTRRIDSESQVLVPLEHISDSEAALPSRSLPFKSRFVFKFVAPGSELRPDLERGWQSFDETLNVLSCVCARVYTGRPHRPSRYLDLVTVGWAGPVFAASARRAADSDKN
jgi:hypothetical protein